MSLKSHVPDSIVGALARLRPEDAEALYSPQTVVKLAAEVEVLRIIAGNIHPCVCRLAPNPEGIDQAVKCACPCHKRIDEALIIWNPERLPDQPGVIEEEVDSE